MQAEKKKLANPGVQPTALRRGYACRASQVLSLPAFFANPASAAYAECCAERAQSGCPKIRKSQIFCDGAG
jgi:hypothetical protein